LESKQYTNFARNDGHDMATPSSSSTTTSSSWTPPPPPPSSATPKPKKLVKGQHTKGEEEEAVEVNDEEVDFRLGSLTVGTTAMCTVWRHILAYSTARPFCSQSEYG
jgi:hypothetical protein